MTNKKIYQVSYWTLIIISPLMYWCVFSYSMNDMGRHGMPMIQGMEILALPSLILALPFLLLPFFLTLLVVSLLLWRKGFHDEVKRKRSLWIGIIILLLPFIFSIADIMVDIAKNLP